MSDWVTVDSVDNITPGDARVVELDDTTIAVINLSGEFFALEDICSHDGSAMLSCGLGTDEVIDGEEMICPHHGARFCIRTGAALAPPAYEPVTMFPVRVENGVVQVRDHRDD